MREPRFLASLHGRRLEAASSQQQLLAIGLAATSRQCRVWREAGGTSQPLESVWGERRGRERKRWTRGRRYCSVFVLSSSKKISRASPGPTTSPFSPLFVSSFDLFLVSLIARTLSEPGPPPCVRRAPELYNYAHGWPLTPPPQARPRKLIGLARMWIFRGREGTLSLINVIIVNHSHVVTFANSCLRTFIAVCIYTHMPTKQGWTTQFPFGLFFLRRHRAVPLFIPLSSSSSSLSH